MADDLTLAQKTVLEKLAHSKLREKFYWTGGTALTHFYLRHRLSNDIDLFSDQPFRYEEIFPLILEIKSALAVKKVEEKRIFDRWEFLLHLKDRTELRAEFVLYEFPKLKPRKKWSGIFVDSLDDMAANKTMAMIDRTEPKDAFDIYFILKKKYFSPEQLLKNIQRKFGVKFSLSTFWSESLKDAAAFDKLFPLLDGSRAEREKLVKEITAYYEKKAAQFLKIQWE